MYFSNLQTHEIRARVSCSAFESFFIEMTLFLRNLKGGRRKSRSILRCKLKGKL